jgi:hypothetical protein
MRAHTERAQALWRPPTLASTVSQRKRENTQPSVTRRGAAPDALQRNGNGARTCARSSDLFLRARKAGTCRALLHLAAAGYAAGGGGACLGR